MWMIFLDFFFFFLTFIPFMYQSIRAAGWDGEDVQLAET